MLAKASKGWNLVAKLGNPELLKVLYTDFTAIWYAGGGKKAYLMPLVDHATKWVAGWALGYRPNTELALECLSMAHTTLGHVGLTLEDRIIHHVRDGWEMSRSMLLSSENVRVGCSVRMSVPPLGWGAADGRDELAALTPWSTCGQYCD